MNEYSNRKRKHGGDEEIKKIRQRVPPDKGTIVMKLLSYNYITIIINSQSSWRCSTFEV